MFQSYDKGMGWQEEGPISIGVAITAEGFLPLPFFTDVLARDRTGDTLAQQGIEPRFSLFNYDRVVKAHNATLHTMQHYTQCKTTHNATLHHTSIHYTTLCTQQYNRIWGWYQSPHSSSCRGCLINYIVQKGLDFISLNIQKGTLA